jgi:hypothetical protein
MEWIRACPSGASVELVIGTVSSPILVPLPGVSSDIPDDEGEGHVASLQYLVAIRYTRSEIRLICLKLNNF